MWDSSELCRIVSVVMPEDHPFRAEQLVSCIFTSIVEVSTTRDMIIFKFVANDDFRTMFNVLLLNEIR